MSNDRPKSRTKITPELMDILEKNIKLSDLLEGLKPMMKSKPSPTFEGGKMKNVKDAPEEFAREQKKKRFAQGRARTAQQQADMSFMKEGGLAEATAKLKAKGMKEGGMVVKDKVVAIDKSPNSGLITVKGFGAGRRT